MVVVSLLLAFSLCFSGVFFFFFNASISDSLNFIFINMMTSWFCVLVVCIQAGHSEMSRDHNSLCV